jgi:hypothetical protein
MVTPLAPEPEGQSEAAKAWVARRDAFASAAAAVEESQKQARVLEEQHVARQQAGANPVVFVVGFVVVFAALALFAWFFIERVQCDPMISDRGFSGACRRAVPP